MNIIDYQKEVINLIDNSFKKNQITHAYIFEGERGSGLKDVALYFAKKLLCTDEIKPCDKCANCKRVTNGTHTNVMIISPVQGVVRKDQINSIIHEGSMTSLTEPNKVYIIEEAEKMNRSSANALLKFLEEPYPNNYLILLTENSNVLLETITSRTQLVRFRRINKNILVDNLQKDGIDKDVAYILSELFGSFDESKEALKKGTIINVIELFKKLVAAKHNKKDIYVEYFLNKKLIESSEAAHWLLEIFELYKREEIRYIEKRDCNYFLSLIENEDYKEINTIDIASQIDDINSSLEKINAKVNIDLVLAGLLQKL